MIKNVLPSPPGRKVVGFEYFYISEINFLAARIFPDFRIFAQPASQPASQPARQTDRETDSQTARQHKLISSFTTRGGEGKSTFSLIFFERISLGIIGLLGFYVDFILIFLFEKSKVRSRFFIRN